MPKSKAQDNEMLELNLTGLGTGTGVAISHKNRDPIMEATSLFPRSQSGRSRSLKETVSFVLLFSTPSFVL
jgi:hypothetical protein